MTAMASRGALTDKLLISSRMQRLATLMAVLGALIGGTLGGKLAGRIKPFTLRWTVVVIGLIISIIYFVRA